MKVLISILVLLLSPAAWASYVQGAVGSAASTAASATAITVTSGDLIVAASKSQASATGSTVVFSSTGVTCTWTKLTENWVTTFASDLGWCVVGSSGSMTVTATWTITAGSGFTDIGIAEESPGGGFSFTGSPLDQSAVLGSAVPTTTCTSNASSATTNANDQLIGVCFNFNTAQTYGAATGFTFRSASSRNTLGFYDAVISATGAQTFTTTVSSDISTGWVLALKLTAAATPVRRRAEVIQ